MYGKIFESLYHGSMVGSGSAVFAVWGYVIAHMREDRIVGAQVDLNPKVLAFLLGEEQGVVEGVLKLLCGPDAQSTSKAEEGRRLIKLGEFAYQVVNGAKYMSIRNAEERREYNRQAKRDERSRAKVGLKKVKAAGAGTTSAERGHQKAVEAGDTATAQRYEEIEAGLAPGSLDPKALVAETKALVGKFRPKVEKVVEDPEEFRRKTFEKMRAADPEAFPEEPAAAQPGEFPEV